MTNYRQYLKSNLFFNNQIDKKSYIAVNLIPEDIRSELDHMSCEIHDNEITRILFDFLAKQPVGHKHKYVIDALSGIFD